MDYVQMTLDDWMSIKSELEQELRNAAAGFVRIGYLLRKAEESEGYKNDGYDTLTEWAHDNYGLTASQVSRFKAINRKYSIDGYSNQLLPEYANYGQSKLTEMLQLSDESMEMVSPEMRRDDIREIKAFERQAPTAEPVQEWIREFISANAIPVQILNTKAYRENNLQGMIEEINPTGTKTFRTGRTMVSMMPDRIMVREFPNPAERMEWSEFFEKLREELSRRQREAEEETARKQQEERADQEKEKEETISEPEPDRPGTNVPQQPTIPPMPKLVHKEPVTEPEENKNPVSEELPAEEEPAAGVAPAQMEEPADIVNSNVEQDSEEPEQVEIDEILPAPTTVDKLTELKDRFKEALNTLRMMCDVENFDSMDQTIDRLKILKERMIKERSGNAEE